jgi:ATP-dependent Clp protease ATP-binding subunit ClpA
MCRCRLDDVIMFERLRRGDMGGIVRKNLRKVSTELD